MAPEEPGAGAAGSDAGPPERDIAAGQLAAALEAVCFVLNRPLEFGELAAIVERPRPEVEAATEVLAVTLSGRGLMLQRHLEEIQLVTRPEVAWAVQRALRPERAARLSRAAMETLAIVAYRQPVTRAAVEAIRGVGCETVLESLERRQLIEEVGRKDTPGHPRLYGTTLRFLQVVGLESVTQLPPLEGDAAASALGSRFGLAAAPAPTTAPGGATNGAGGVHQTAAAISPAAGAK